MNIYFNSTKYYLKFYLDWEQSFIKIFVYCRGEQLLDIYTTTEEIKLPTAHGVYCFEGITIVLIRSEVCFRKLINTTMLKSEKALEFQEPF